MATSSVPGAIDYLVTAITGLPECALPVIVEDGWPTRSAPQGVGIGVIPGDGTTDDEVVWGQLGAGSQWETYEIPCIVWAHVGEASAKKARDQAFTVFNAIVAKLRTNPDGVTLGGALNSGTAIVHNVKVVQSDTAEESAAGRMCEIRFSVGCKNKF